MRALKVNEEAAGPESEAVACTLERMLVLLDKQGSVPPLCPPHPAIHRLPPTATRCNFSSSHLRILASHPTLHRTPPTCPLPLSLDTSVTTAHLGRQLEELPVLPTDFGQQKLQFTRFAAMRCTNAPCKAVLAVAQLCLMALCVSILLAIPEQPFRVIRRTAECSELADRLEAIRSPPIVQIIREYVTADNVRRVVLYVLAAILFLQMVAPKFLDPVVEALPSAWRYQWKFQVSRTRLIIWEVSDSVSICIVHLLGSPPPIDLSCKAPDSTTHRLAICFPTPIMHADCRGASRF